MHGHGVYEYPDGRKYAGSWKYNRMFGHGEYSWPDGRKYIGNVSHYRYKKFLRDKKHGYGILIHADGTIFKGTWEYDK